MASILYRFKGVIDENGEFLSHNEMLTEIKNFTRNRHNAVWTELILDVMFNYYLITLDGTRWLGVSPHGKVTLENIGSEQSFNMSITDWDKVEALLTIKDL